MAVKTFQHKDLEKKRTATVATLLSLAAAAASSLFLLMLVLLLLLVRGLCASTADSYLCAFCCWCVCFLPVRVLLNAVLVLPLLLL
jgi:hypothetical protein